MSQAGFWDDIYADGRGGFILGGDDALVASCRHFGNIQDAKVLDLGCGDGASSLYFAERGAKVTAIDNSPVAIQQLSNICLSRGINNISPVVCSAFEIDKLGPFDFVFGSMILHHLEPFNEFAAVLRRSVASGGKAFFYENNAYSDLLIWCRNNLVGKWGIPKNGDDDEFPLLPQEVQQLAEHFNAVTFYPELFFFRLASNYLFKGKIEKQAHALDRYFYRFQFFRKYSYRQYVLLS